MLPDRITAKIVTTDEGCWEWTGARALNGYGRVNVKHEDGGWRPRGAHRVVYELVNGPIATGLDIDHLCRNRGCVNPDHMEAVTRSENLRRSPLVGRKPFRTHCPHGHPYDNVNTYVDPRGWRQCRACIAQRRQEAS